MLLIVADDFGTDSSSLYNTNSAAKLPPTPNIESLAKNGLLFRNAYSYPTCSPTRCTMLTGRYGFRTGIGYALATPTDPTLSANEFTLPEALDANPQLGYQHASIGKWHLSFNAADPNTLGGWAHFSGVLLGAVSDYSRWPKTVNGNTTLGYSTYATTDNANDAISWIGAQNGKPWMLWLAFNAAHTPFHKPPNDLHSYDGLPNNQVAINQNPRPYYEAMVEAMDTEIGRVLAAVDRQKTTIIFLGDNGTLHEVIQPPYTPERSKGTLYEGGIRVPLIIAGTAVANPHRESQAIVHTVDLFATILELAGVNVTQTIPKDQAIDSRSLLPLIQNQPFAPRETCLLSENFSGSLPDNVAGRALRNEQFKLIQFKNGQEEFYDLLADPVELTNLLSGGLTAEQKTNYDALGKKSAQWQNQPAAATITSATLSSGQFTTAVNRVEGVQYSLWRSTDAVGTSWTIVTDMVTETVGDQVRLTDKSASDERRFYRVATANQ